jgi:prevent-host-death family protein
MERTLSVSVADAKKRFSQLLGQVEHGGATVIVTKRGRAVARLVAADAMPGSLKDVKGWLDDTHPFLAQVDEIVKHRSRQSPRPLRAPRATRK